MSKLAQLREMKAEKAAEARTIIDAAENDNRTLTDDEETKLAAIKGEVSDLEKRIDNQVELSEIERSAVINAPADARVEVTPAAEADTKQHGFASFGDFAKAVAASSRGQVTDERLFIGAAPTTYGNESSGADGGFIVPPAYSSSIYEHSLEGDAFLPMTDGDTVSGNSMTFPTDETTPWGSNGVQAYWEDEAAQMAQSTPKFGSQTLRLSKLTSLVPVTDELLEDAGALNGYLPRKTSTAIRWKTNDSIINGNGVAKPLGIFNAAALVTQAKEGSQVADTIVAENIVKMFSRSTNPGGSVWLVHPDAFPQLPLLSINNQPVYTMPGNGIQSAPAGMLLGRPVIMTDTAQTVGDKGDIYFVDFSAFKSITKQGGIQTATSIHLWFDYNTTAFRATFRVAGRPWLESAISPAKGATTRSPFVCLAARA